MYSPILMSDSFLIGVNQKVQPLTDHFQNPFRTPMLIDEIRMSFDESIEDPTAVDPFSIQLKLALGRDPLTNDFIPMPMLGKLLNPGRQTNDPLIYTWKFPRPLYVPGTELLIPTMFNSPMPGTAGRAAPVRLTYAGRSLDPNYQQPKTIALPFAAIWKGLAQGIDLGNVPTSDDSTESDLVNPFDRPLYVQRMIGRIRATNSDGVGTAAGTGDALDDLNDSSLAQNSTLIQMTDSLGRQAVRDPTPFSNVFNAIDRAWTINTMLPPKGFFIVHLDEDYGSSLSDSDFAQPMVSMIGYRAVTLEAA